MKKIILTITTAIVVVCGWLMCVSCSCTSVAEKFRQTMESSVFDKKIDDLEFANLLSLVKSEPGFTVLHNGQNYTMTDEASLVEFILNYKTPALECGKCPIKENVSFDNLKIYLENSASMAGYSNAGNPTFTAPLLSLFNVVDDNTVIETAYVGEKSSQLQLTPVDEEDFKSELTNGRIATTEGSPLNDIINMMIDSIDKNTVSCLVTDGIVSGSNKEIATSVNREFTIKNLPLIEERMRSSMKKAADKGMSLLLYRLESPYKGTYYDYKNGRHSLKSDVVRPYFVTIFGAESNLRKVEKALESEMKFKPTHKFSSYDENSYKTVTKAFLTMAPGQAGVEVQVAPNTATIDFDGNVPAVPVSFKLQVALNGVPSHHLGKDVIMEALQIYYVDPSSNVEVMKPEFIQDVQKDEAKVNVYHITFGMDSNFIQNIPSNGMKLYARVPGKLNRWDEALSSDDDVQFGLLPNTKTFALTTLMNGIYQGFGFHKGLNDVMKIEINIIK